MLQSHIERGATTLPYADPSGEASHAEVVDTFGPLELEYAALRKGCVLLDLPHRTGVLVRGADRLEFLNRMLTQELKGLEAWRSRRSFWLNRKGRIDADMRVTELGDAIRLDLDVHAAARTTETLGAFLFAEDVELQDQTETHHRLALHGPTSILLLGEVAEAVGGPRPAELRPGEACRVRIAGAEVLVERDDSAGEIGLELCCATELVEAVYNELLSRGAAPDHAPDADAPQKPEAFAASVRLRPAGWHAWNIARIETGTPLFYMDFGTGNLPHETGALADRVSFTKGCYLGQEVVARMQSLGHPKQRLVALRFENDTDPELLQPVTGAGVFPPGDATKSVGQITSSTISPMLGAVPVCFAMVRYAQTTPGTGLEVAVEGGRIAGSVQEELAFWKRG